MKTKIFYFACLILSFSVSHALDQDFEKQDLSKYGLNGIPSGIVQLGGSSKYFSPYVFLVDKSARILSIWQEKQQGLEMIAAYPTDIGKNKGNKRFLGDGATPEGIYFMKEKLEGPSLNYSLYGSNAFTLNYPNFFDQKSKKTGSGIWVHAVPDKVSLLRGSRGCVVVRDQVIKTLNPYFKSGFTPVIIQDKIEFQSPQEFSKKHDLFIKIVENWRHSWETKDIDNYIGLYHPEFTSLKMNRDRWKTYKRALNEKYESISVKISKPVIYEHNDEAVIRFVQNYESNKKIDYGEKTLYLKKLNGTYLILGEEWRADREEALISETKTPDVATGCNGTTSDCGARAANTASE